MPLISIFCLSRALLFPPYKITADGRIGLNLVESLRQVVNDVVDMFRTDA